MTDTEFNHDDLPESFKEFHIKRCGSWPGPRGVHYDIIFIGLCESFAEYADLMVKRMLDNGKR